MKNFSLIQFINFGIFCKFLVIDQINSAPVNINKSSGLNAVVIGAGISGLSSAKHLLAQGYNVTIYEQASEIGGTWFYTNQTGKDMYGVKIHSAMYQGLKANLDSPFMQYPDFPIQSKVKYDLPQADILKYINSYAEHFDIKKHVKLNHLVVRVLPIEDAKWEVIVKDLPNDAFHTLIYDYVFVCNGIYSKPHIPSIPGIEEFKGKFLHSHDYRNAEDFRNQSVLVIGDGASARDISDQLREIGTNVTRSMKNPSFEWNDHNENTDRIRTFDNFSVVIFATGYNYSYPFLSVQTGIHIEDNSVSPLYKQIFNIEHPTMVFIGIPVYTMSFIVYDYQVQFAMKFVSGEKKLPSKSEMYLDTQNQWKRLEEKGYSKRHTHKLKWFDQMDYFKQLAEAAEIKNVFDVMAEMEERRRNITKIITNLLTDS